MTPLQVSRYHPALTALHWVLAVLIIADLFIGANILVHIPSDAPRKIAGLRAHATGGIVILALMTLRLALRVRTPAPAALPTGSIVLDRVAWLSHRLLYVTVFGMGASGLVMALQAHLFDTIFFGIGTLPSSLWDYPLRSAHYFLSRSLMALVALHICGALYHTLVRKDQALSRMGFGRPQRAKAIVTNKAAPSAGISRAWYHTAWISRVILAIPALLFILIGERYVGHPVQVAATSGVVLSSAAAITDTRAVGAVFVALAVLVAFSISSAQRLLGGLILVAVVIGFITAARVFGILVDGAASETIFKLLPEVILLGAATVGISIEVRRRRAAAAALSNG